MPATTMRLCALVLTVALSGIVSCGDGGGGGHGTGGLGGGGVTGGTGGSHGVGGIAGGAGLGGTAGSSGASGFSGGGGNATGGAPMVDCATCKPNTEYCASAWVNGAHKLSVCRAYPNGCSTCGCARVDALPTIKQVSACANYTANGLTCTDNGVVIGADGSSANLRVACMVP